MKKLIRSLEKAPHYLNYCLLAGAVLAQGPSQIEIVPPAEWGPLQHISVPGMVSTLIKFTLIVAAVVAFIFMVWGGIKWITSGGDKEGTAKAQSTITAALIGLVIVFAAWAIIRLIETFFGFPILSTLEIEPIPTD